MSAGGGGSGVVGLAGNFGSMISGIIGAETAPGVPKATQIGDLSSSAFYGVNPNQQRDLSDLQAKLASATTDAEKAKIQKSIDSLQTQIAKTQSQGNVQQFLGNLGSELPQLQGIANTQNQSAEQAALTAQQQMGLPVGQSILGAQTALAPQFYSGQSQLGNQLFNSPLGLSPQETQYFTNQLNAGQAANGMYGSPLSSQNTALNLTGLNLQQANTQLGQQQNYLNNYLQPQVPNVYGQISQLGQMGTAQLGGNSLQSLSPQDFLSLQSNLSGLKFAQETQQANALAQLGGGWINGAGGGIGGGSSMFGGTAAAPGGMTPWLNGQNGGVGVSTMSGGGFGFS